jgi:hypothetical protein
MCSNRLTDHIAFFDYSTNMVFMPYGVWYKHDDKCLFDYGTSMIILSYQSIAPTCSSRLTDHIAFFDYVQKWSYFLIRVSHQRVLIVQFFSYRLIENLMPKRTQAFAYCALQAFNIAFHAHMHHILNAYVSY